MSRNECRMICIFSYFLFCVHHGYKFVIIDKTISIDVGLLYHHFHLLLGQLLAQVQHDLGEQVVTQLQLHIRVTISVSRCLPVYHPPLDHHRFVLSFKIN